MDNKDIANIFFEIADILEMQNIQWKPQAYRKAARTIEQLPEPLKDIYTKGGIKALDSVPGVGKHISKKIETLITTGKLPYYEDLKKNIPGHLNELMEIKSLGPKKVRLLYEKLKISSVSQLKEAVKKHRIASLKGFGEKTEQDILKSIGLYERRRSRFLLGEALPLANSIIEHLKSSKEVQHAEYAGSLRRMQETIGDIDILVISSSPEKIMDMFTKMEDVSQILAKGPTRSSVLLKNDMQVDLRVLPRSSFGAAQQYFIGNKEHNVRMRQLAIQKGMKLSEYGLFKKDKLIEARSEERIYKLLCKNHIPPEIRNNTGEIEAAMKNSLPKLIGYDSITADLHMHSHNSDGSNSIEEMALAAKKLGYRYIAITDHSKSQYQANGMDEQRLKKYIKEIHEINDKIKGIEILAGCEVDILKDGILDFKDPMLKELDIVIASVHSGFKMPKETMTKRIIKAIENPNVNIIAHPTGRLINERDPYDFDFNKICKAAVENNVALEINSHPARLDLNDINSKLANSLGVKLVINTDSHITHGLNNIVYGIGVARRAWLEKKDILNTLAFSKFKKALL